jgi:hypothetical protein
MEDNFFTEVSNNKPYLKAAFEGFAGSGKTHTAALLAIGLHRRIGSKKPVIIFDTEKASKFLEPLFRKAKIKLLVKDSRSLSDLKETMKRLRDGLADILLIDSISHVWEGFLEAYKRKVNRQDLQFQDWGVIKPAWRTEFSDPFVRDPYHIVMCGRAGYEYDSEINERGKREIFKSAVKMKVEGDTAYEPDLLLLMERIQVMRGVNVERVVRRATILKDRSTLLDGKTFENPTYENFAPAVNLLLTNPVETSPTHQGDDAALFKTGDDKREYFKQKDIQLEQIEALLVMVAPGSVGKDKQYKTKILFEAFDQCASWEAIKQLSPKGLEAGYGRIKTLLERDGKISMKDGKVVLGKETEVTNV